MEGGHSYYQAHYCREGVCIETVSYIHTTIHVDFTQQYMANTPCTNNTRFDERVHFLVRYVVTPNVLLLDCYYQLLLSLPLLARERPRAPRVLLFVCLVVDTIGIK